MKILITGSSGYIGRRLTRLARERKFALVLAGRRAPAGKDAAAEWIHFDLRTPAPFTIPESVEAVVHLAADTKGDELAIENEKQSTLELLKASEKIGARFVFVSSQTAREDAPTQYGRTKWAIERAVLGAQGFVVRPGQVYGGEEKGLFGTLVKLVEKLPILPAFLPAPAVQPIHVDDLVSGILKVVTSKTLAPAVYSLGQSTPVSFTGFLQSIVENRVRRHRFFVPVPTILVTLMIRLLGTRLTTKFGLNRLNSLFDLPTMGTETDLQTLGLKLRTLDTGLHPSGNSGRRHLLKEAQAILGYILREPPCPSLTKRYARMIESVRAGAAMPLPSWLLQCPAALSLINERARRPTKLEAEFQWRINSATLIAESSRQGAERFLGSSKQKRFFNAAIHIMLAVLSEAAWRIIRPLAYRLKHREHGLNL